MRPNASRLVIYGLVIYFAVFNIALFYGYSTVRSIIAKVSEFEGLFAVLGNFEFNEKGFNRLMESKEFAPIWQSFMRQAITHTDRVVSVALDDRGRASKTFFDVSLDGEFTFVFRHLVKNHPEIDLLSSSNYVVDIGAYDGMIQSNSYNFFFDLGWSALLVEPSRYNLKALNPWAGEWRTRGLNVTVAAVAVGKIEGTIQFFDSDISAQSSLAPTRDDKTSKGEYYDVQVVNPSKLFKKYNIPKDFAVLSVDVEGTNNIVVMDLIDSGYRPRYIIGEAVGGIVPNLAAVGYVVLGNFRYNTILALPTPMPKSN